MNKGDSNVNYNLSFPNGNYRVLTLLGVSISTNNIKVSSGSHNVNVSGNSFDSL